MEVSRTNFQRFKNSASFRRRVIARIANCVNSIPASVVVAQIYIFDFKHVPLVAVYWTFGINPNLKQNNKRKFHFSTLLDDSGNFV